MVNWLKWQTSLRYKLRYFLSALIGRLAEFRAAWFLCGQPGCTILARNFRSRGGELDLVVLLNGVLVFVEVRYRSSMHFGGAITSVDGHKQRCWLRAAQDFLIKYPKFSYLPMRFDLITFQAKGRWSLGTLTWYQQVLEKAW